MPVKRPPLINGEIYHIVNRAVDGAILFREENDYYRMIRNIFEFNDEDPVEIRHKIIFNIVKQGVKIKGRPRMNPKKRDLLVEVLAFCLMPNHIHLLLCQKKNGGISKFMRKFGAGYGLYYNNKYARKGHIFQGRFRAVHVKTDEQLMTVFVYVHTNPIAIIFPGWKEKGIPDFKEARDFIENYKWSSYADYLDKQDKNFPSLTSRDFLKKVIGDSKQRREFVNAWLQHKKELADFDQIAIE